MAFWKKENCRDRKHQWLPKAGVWGGTHWGGTCDLEGMCNFSISSMLLHVVVISHLYMSKIKIVVYKKEILLYCVSPNLKRETIKES